MQKTFSTNPIERVTYFDHFPRPAEVYLHENIEQVEIVHSDGETETQWTADEVYIKTHLSKQEVEENFDAIWVKAETEAKTQGERIEELETLVGDLIDVVLEVA